MPSPILPKHQAQASPAAAAAQAPAGPNAKKENGQHAKSGPANSWRSPWGQWPALSRGQQWSHWSRYTYICWHAASYSTDTHPREHVCFLSAARSRNGWNGRNGNSSPATAGSAARWNHAPSTPSPSVSASGWWGWRGDDELTSAADGASAPAAAS